MHNDSHKFEVVVIGRVLELQLSILIFCDLLEVLLGVLGHIQLSWELKVIVYFDADHLVEIKFKSLQRNDQVARKVLDASTLQSINFLVAFLAEILIALVEHVTFDESIQAFVNLLFVFHRDA